MKSSHVVIVVAVGAVAYVGRERIKALVYGTPAAAPRSNFWRDLVSAGAARPESRGFLSDILARVRRTAPSPARLDPFDDDLIEMGG